MRTPIEADAADRQIRMEEQIRQLRLRAGRPFPWYPISPYLCGGWVDDREVPTPFRYETNWDPGYDGSQAGFFDTGNALIFTGYINWDPNGWWATPPAPAAVGGTPDVRYDAVSIIAAGKDGFGNVVAADHDDAGHLLPVNLGDISAIPLMFPQYSGSANLEGPNDGAVLRVVAQSNPGNGTGLYTPYVTQGGGQFCDTDGFTHTGPIDGSQWLLDGAVLRYESHV